jgi:hypothetical protein
MPVVIAKAGDKLLRPKRSGRRDTACMPPHRMDHRTMRDPGNEPVVRLRGGDIVDSRSHEQQAERGDDSQGCETTEEEADPGFLSLHARLNAGARVWLSD